MELIIRDKDTVDDFFFVRGGTNRPWGFENEPPLSIFAFKIGRGGLFCTPRTKKNCQPCSQSLRSVRKSRQGGRPHLGLKTLHLKKVPESLRK